MRGRTAVACACTLAGLVLATSGWCEYMGKGKYYGYAAVDRWGQKVFHKGPYHLFLSDAAFAGLKDRLGRPLALNVTKLGAGIDEVNVIEDFDSVEEKSCLPGLTISLTCARNKVKAGEGVKLTVRVDYGGLKPVTLRPEALCAVFVTRDPAEPAGYRGPGGIAYWYYRQSRLRSRAGGGNLCAASHMGSLGFTVEQMVASGREIVQPKDRWGSVELAPGASFEATVTLEKVLPSGQYQVLAAYENGNFSHEAGAMSPRVDIDVMDVNAAE